MLTKFFIINKLTSIMSLIEKPQLSDWDLICFWPPETSALNYEDRPRLDSKLPPLPDWGVRTRDHWPVVLCIFIALKIVFRFCSQYSIGHIIVAISLSIAKTYTSWKMLSMNSQSLTYPFPPDCYTCFILMCLDFSKLKFLAFL